MSEKEKVAFQKKLIVEFQTRIKQEDSWLLVSFDVTENREVKLSPDTIFAGYEKSRELRGPRWRTLESAKVFESVGFKHIVAGRLGMAVLAKLIKDKKIPKGVVVHKSAIHEWLPDLAEAKPTLNSVKGFLNPDLPENKGLAAKRPGVAKRRKLKKGNSCHFCGTVDNLTLHHLIRRNVGGATEDDNLLVVCRDCHDKIHEKEIDDLTLVLEVSVKRTQNLLRDL